jgi:isopentenyl phosphate kinase
MNTRSIKQALEAQILPVLYGDVAFDTARGGTIVSTEMLFTYLAGALPVTRILLVGEVAGVLDDDGQVIERISPGTEAAAGGVDVTGGMLTKVSDMLALVKQTPGLEIRILDGTQAGRLADALLGKPVLSTLIHAD